jgi:hypothetical protein
MGHKGTLKPRISSVPYRSRALEDAWRLGARDCGARSVQEVETVARDAQAFAMVSGAVA